MRQIRQFLVYAALLITPSVYAQSASLSLPSNTTNLLGGERISAGNEDTLNFGQGDLWGRLREGFRLAPLDSELIQEHEEWYAARPDYVQRMIERSKRYLFHITDEVEKRGMPAEIALLPMIESAFNPVAYSRSHASGIWQFIPSTGKNFGLEQNATFDGRRDVVQATRAALDYLQKLYDMFGSWELALAAYNWGEGSVSRAIAKNQAKGLPTDYLSLSLPPETRNYVPRLLAVKNIVNNPNRYGLKIASIPNRPYFIAVPTPQKMDVKVAAELADISVSEFNNLNPAHKRSVISKTDTHILLPADKADNFINKLNNYDKPLLSWQTYTVRRGDHLSTIAPRFGISVAELKQANGLGAIKRPLPSGYTLLVPNTGGGVPLSESVNDEQLPSTTVPSFTTRTVRVVHTIRRGESLASLAKEYDVPVRELQNQFRKRPFKVGARLHITQQRQVALQSPGAEKSGKGVNRTPRYGRTIAKNPVRYQRAATSKPRRVGIPMAVKKASTKKRKR